MNKTYHGENPFHVARYFILSVLIICVDQLTKWFVVSHIPLRTIALKWFGDLVYIVHVRNTVVAFSMGENLPDAVKPLLFIILPLGVLAFLAVWIVRGGGQFSTFQKWVIAGIIGGGLGNLIDRIFRPEGVVDFISVYFPFFGFERWPTFNMADSSVVVCGILLFISLLGSKVEHTGTEKRGDDMEPQEQCPEIFSKGSESQEPVIQDKKGDKDS
ncbi:signal peptidase II [Parasphaerochaeta coccoides]|uniref:Lipoprotein signal peptidase n=1 Tax=Parasphaerochaeta coccoides (strain ATCC BAA-1237 / DSM 17374 / SPN1) TaxID=760011 RepID=F4GJW1_PARC1|nr:signal peptidase II [Parasphaerochaeta coccoides]AEC01386.1 Lipoprotein signal peptidase [Parasphaerochaeta coccoides DSM 17374]